WLRAVVSVRGGGEHGGDVDDDGWRLAWMVVAVVLAAAGVAVEGDGDVNGGVKGMTMMSGGRVWGRWGDEAAEERLVAGVWVAGGWPERVAAPDSGGGRRKPNGRRGRDDLCRVSCSSSHELSVSGS
ncbi:hypothetical protein Tco_0231721, partial [Tanacetum coccineum]